MTETNYKEKIEERLQEIKKEFTLNKDIAIQQEQKIIDAQDIIRKTSEEMLRLQGEYKGLNRLLDNSKGAELNKS